MRRRMKRKRKRRRRSKAQAEKEEGKEEEEEEATDQEKCQNRRGRNICEGKEGGHGTGHQEDEKRRRREWTVGRVD